MERAVGGFPGVDDVAAVGVPSPLGDEEVLVAVVATDAVDWSKLTTHCGEQLPAYAVPLYFRRVDNLPRTATGRVEKYKLVAAGVTEDTWDRTAIEGAASR